jgi:hypothetical protein
MSTTSAVTLSNENGPSRSRSYREPHPGSSGVQRPACALQRPRPPSAAFRQPGTGRP